MTSIGIYLRDVIGNVESNIEDNELHVTNYQLFGKPGIIMGLSGTEQYTSYSLQIKWTKIRGFNPILHIGDLVTKPLTPLKCCKVTYDESIFSTGTETGIDIGVTWAKLNLEDKFIIHDLKIIRQHSLTEPEPEQEEPSNNNSKMTISKKDNSGNKMTESSGVGVDINYTKNYESNVNYIARVICGSQKSNGFILRNNLLLTGYSTVKNNETIYVQHRTQILKAKLRGFCQYIDVALIQTEGYIDGIADNEGMMFEDMTKVDVTTGDDVIYIWNNEKITQSVSKGIIRNISLFHDMKDWISTDFDIPTTGTKFGPIILAKKTDKGNGTGGVIGIYQRTYEGFHLCLPCSKEVVEIISQMVEDATSPVIDGMSSTEILVNNFGWSLEPFNLYWYRYMKDNYKVKKPKHTYGLIVTDTLRGGVVRNSGLSKYDLITHCDNIPLVDVGGRKWLMLKLMLNQESGHQFKLSYYSFKSKYRNHQTAHVFTC